MRNVQSLVRILALTTGLAAVTGLPAIAQSSEAPTPPANVIDLFSEVFSPTAVPGGANDGSCFVANATATEVRVRLQAEVEFADGTVSRLTGNFNPGVLLPGGAFELSIFFVVPPDAALGPAVFRCSAQGQSLDSRGKPETEVSESAFEVVAP